jgi:hypothetical protein
MTKTAQLDALFRRWEDAIPEYKHVFVKDGIVEEDTWNTTSPKILFIAKEPNHFEHPMAGDFRKDWKDGTIYPFAQRIAEWSFGIHEGFKEFGDIEYTKHKPTSLYYSYLQKIAFMNIKKRGGGSVCDAKQLLAHINTAEHLACLHEQIVIIDPDLIILGLSWGAAERKIKELVLPGINEVLEQCNYSIEVGKLGKRRIIDFYHPSSRNGPSASYSLLQNVVNSNVFKSLR